MEEVKVWDISRTDAILGIVSSALAILVILVRICFGRKNNNTTGGRLSRSGVQFLVIIFTCSTLGVFIGIGLDQEIQGSRHPVPFKIVVPVGLFAVMTMLWSRTLDRE